MVVLSFPALLFLAFITPLVTSIPSPTTNPSKQWTFAEIPPTHSLTWYPCEVNFTCAMLDVPLDYTNRTLGRSYIPLIRYAATTTTSYKGMILTNPGGPGGSGVQFLMDSIALGLPDLTIVGTNYDIVSWDPRGIGQAIPAANCTLPSNLQRRSFEKIFGPELNIGYFETAYNESVEIGVACQDSIGANTQAGPHVTTVMVVRDIISILDAYARTTDGRSIGDDAKLLNYWGFSYGTYIGQTFASMYHNRLGKVVLDGNVNPYDWSQFTGVHLATDTDAVFSLFFVYCSVAGVASCPFATGSTSHDVYLRFESLVSNFDPTYAFQQGWSNATAIESLLATMKSLLFSLSYQPIDYFPVIGEGLVALEAISSNVTLENLAALEDELGLFPTSAVDPVQIWELAVLCTDITTGTYGKTLDQLYPQLTALENESWLAGEYLLTQLLGCATWPITSTYRYSGPFTAKTNSPILFVGNTFDPVTPHQNSVNATLRFSGSQLLTIEGLGHTSLATQNKCAYSKIGAFFQHGTLPGSDNYCALEAGPWNMTLPGPLSGLSDKRDLMAVLPSATRISVGISKSGDGSMS